MSALKPYPTMKDSGVPWLGHVPEHWQVKRGKAIFRSIDIRSSTGEEELLTVSSDRGVVPRSSATVTMFKAESYVGYKLCWPGDLVINSLWAWARGLGVSQYHGIVSSAYGVYRLRPPYKDYSAYIHELVRSAPFNWELRVRSKGIWISRLQLTDEAFFGAPFPLPPVGEQVAIVRFLEYVDRRIRRYIRAKQKLIKLLDEQKQAIIHRGVTRGLDHNIRLKPSGVEWLGNVPKHWEVMPIKRAFLSMDYGISESASDSGTIRLLTMGHLKDGRVTVPATGGVDSVDSSLLLQTGDLLFNRTNSPDLVGKVGLFVGHESPVTFASYLVRMRPCPNHEPEYLNAVLNDAAFLSIARREAIPSLHQSNLNPTRYGRLHVALPPQSEQQVILQVLQQETEDLTEGIIAARREIDLLHEYRTRLIADVVTGKLDVRAVAARLPDEAEEPEPLDESEALSDAHEDTADDLDAASEENEL